MLTCLRCQVYTIPWKATRPVLRTLHQQTHGWILPMTYFQLPLRRLQCIAHMIHASHTSIQGTGQPPMQVQVVNQAGFCGKRSIALCCITADGAEVQLNSTAAQRAFKEHCSLRLVINLCVWSGLVSQSCVTCLFLMMIISDMRFPAGPECGSRRSFCFD